jgi:hypothetical protein
LAQKMATASHVRCPRPEVLDKVLGCGEAFSLCQSDVA